MHTILERTTNSLPVGGVRRSLIRSLLTVVCGTVAITTLTVAASTLVVAQGAPPKPLDSKYADPLLKKGTLPNGLRYYVRKNIGPANRAELRLVVDAGSLLEDDDQRGLAHFVEHMAFNGTKRFPKRRLIEYLESVGMTFGGDINASTSFDETIYMLTVPTDRVVLDTAMMILEDWAQNISFEAEEVEAERGVILEERRMREGPQLRQMQRHAPVISGNRYAQRMPIGTGYVLKNAPREALVRYYRDWYRPDLMTIVAVGDFDPAQMEAMIVERFGKIPKRTTPRERTVIEVPNRSVSIASVAEDASSSGYSAMLVAPLGSQDFGWSPQALRRNATAQVFYQALNSRLRVLARSSGTPIRSGSASRYPIARNKYAHAFSLQAEEATTLELGIAAVRAEILRLARYGVTADEFATLKTALIENMTARNLRADIVESSALAQSYVDQALTRVDEPSERVETELLLQFIETVRQEDIQAFAAEIDKTPAWIVLANAPSDGENGTITTTMLLESLRNGEIYKLPPFKDTALAKVLAHESLLTSKPNRGSVTRTRVLDKIQTTELLLANGARVLLKPTMFAKDEIVIRAIAPGGISVASDAEYPSASVTGSLIQQSGFGPYDSKELARRLVGKVGQLGVNIGMYDQQITSAGSPRHVESLFEALYLAFTSPRIDKEAFGKWKKNARRNYPKGFDFQQRRAMTQRHPRERPIAGATADSVDTTMVKAFYKARFADAGQFTFVIVGDFDVEAIKPYIEQYIGGLPGQGAQSVAKVNDLGVRPPTGIVKRTVVGEDSISQTLFTFAGEAPVTTESNTVMRTIATILNKRLLIRLREDLGGTYGTSVSATASSVPYGSEQLRISYQSEPERVSELQQAALLVIDTMVQNGITAEELAHTQNMLMRQRELQSHQNGYWTNLLSRVAVLGESADEVAENYLNPKPVTLDAVNVAMRRVLKRDRYVLVTSLPVRLAPAEKDELISAEW